MNRLVVMTNMNVDGMRVHNETWAQQLKDAMNVNGGDIENASAGDYVMHFLTFGFKILFALVPPAGTKRRRSVSYGASINDIHKIFGFFDPSPLVRIWN